MTNPYVSYHPSCKTYPLTASQLMLQNSLDEFINPGILVIGVCVAIRAPVNIRILTRCLKEEIKRQQCLRIHFTAPDANGRIRQYIVPSLDMDIPFHDLRHLEMDAVESLMTSWSTEGFAEPDAPLFRWSLVTLPDGYHGIYLNIDHRIIDSCGLISMMHDTLMLYCHECYHTALPDMPASYEEALKADLQQEADPVQIEKGTAFWQQLLSEGEPVYTDITGRWKLEKSRSGRQLQNLRSADRIITPADGDMERFFLSTKESERLTDYCRTHGVTLTNLLLMAMRTSLSKANADEPDISLRNYVSCRSSRLNKTSGGCRIHCYPCRTVIPEDTLFSDGIRTIQTLQNGIYRHCTFDPALVEQMITERFHTPPLTTYEGAALTCQPLPITPDHPLLSRFPIRIHWFSSKADIQKLYLTVMQQPQKEGLGFYFKYQTAELRSQDVACYYDSMIQVLTLAADNPRITVKELLSAMPCPYLPDFAAPQA